MPRVHITIYGNVPDYVVVGFPEKIDPAPAASCPSLPPYSSITAQSLQQ